MCGENNRPGESRHMTAGSSPRVRGKREAEALAKNASGLIPACAGKTLPPKLNSSSARAHPRVCGENTSPQRWRVFDQGSSPRVRGKLRKCRRWGSLWGLIPACAGKTEGPFIGSGLVGAHPRVCGENPLESAGNNEDTGSSPRVRGKRGKYLASPMDRGLIPACAGKTPSHPRGRSSHQAHPRVCGENKRG